MYEILVEPSTNETYFNIYDTTLTLFKDGVQYKDGFIGIKYKNETINDIITKVNETYNTSLTPNTCKVYIEI